MIKIRQTKSGKRYEARVKVKGSSVYKTFEGRKAAEAWVNSVRFHRDVGESAFHKPVSVEQMFNAYLDYADEKGRTAGTIKSAKSRFYKHVLTGYGPKVDMSTITIGEHQTFLKMLKIKAVSPASRNRVRTLVKTLFSVAIKHQLFDEAFKTNPFDIISPTEELRDPIQWLNKNEKWKLLNKNQEEYYFSLLFFLLHTGLRIGEGVAIHLEQIESSINILTVDRQFDSADNRIVHRTKGKKFRRIYLIPEVMELLPKIKEGPIFRKSDGTAITSNYFRKFILPEACEKAEIKQINPHALRHTFAAHYLMEGGKVWDLSKILGHSSSQITEETYAHFDIEHVKKRMDVVGVKNNLTQMRLCLGGGG